MFGVFYVLHVYFNADESILIPSECHNLDDGCGKPYQLGSSNNVVSTVAFCK